MPDVPLPKSAWYNEVSNPTARSITYDDGPYEFRFSAVGSSWPDFSSEQGRSQVGDDDHNVGRVVGSRTSQQTDTVSSRRRVGPLRRAGKWIRRRL